MAQVHSCYAYNGKGSAMTHALLEQEFQSAKDWSSAITTAWQRSVVSIIEAGRLLIAAKAALPHGDWGDMIKSKLPFKQSTVNKLMAIARHPLLTKSELIPKLPASWGVLHELSLLPASNLKAALKQGIINPRVERREVRALRPDINLKRAEGKKNGRERHIAPDWQALSEDKRLNVICTIIEASMPKLGAKARARWQTRIGAAIGTPTTTSPSIVAA
jgi:hypothetical protein